MRRMLRRLARLGKEREASCRYRLGASNLSEPDVARDDGEDVVQIMRDPAGERAERFELCSWSVVPLRPLSFGNVVKENRDPPVARISSHLEPNFAALSRASNSTATCSVITLR